MDQIAELLNRASDNSMPTDTLSARSQGLKSMICPLDKAGWAI
jgi:hypothetical protein